MSDRARLRQLTAFAVAVVLSTQTVRADGSASGTVGAMVTVSPIVVGLTLSATTAPAGARVHARATVTNLGPADVGPILLTLRADEAGIRIRGDATRTNRRLASGKAWIVAWTICGRQQGSFVILASARLGNSTIESQGRLLTITAAEGSSC